MASKRITHDQLLLTDAYKKDSRIFFHPSELIDKFIEDITTEYPNSIVNIQVDKEGGAGTEDKKDIVTYGRGLVSIDINDIKDSHYCATIGIIWAYDTSKEVIKLYRGINTFACTNLMISGADDVKVISLTTSAKGEPAVREKIWKRKKEDAMEVIDATLETYLETIEDNFKDNIKIVNFLRSKQVDTTAVDAFIGKTFIDEVICGKFDYSTFNEGCRLLFLRDHPHINRALYFIGRDNNLTMINFYGALTQRITDDKTAIDWITDKTIEVTDLIFRSLGTSKQEILSI